MDSGTRPDHAASTGASTGASNSGKVVAALLVLLVLVPLLYVAWLQPAVYGPFVLVFLLTGVGVYVVSRRGRAKGATRRR